MRVTVETMALGFGIAVLRRLTPRNSGEKRSRFYVDVV